MKKRFFFMMSIAVLMASCKDSADSPDDSGSVLQQEDKNLYNSTIVLGDKLNNPYSLKNMQLAYDSLNRKNGNGLRSADELEANYYYVRFLPKDSVQLNAIKDLELFDYPLDYEVVEWGDFYHDPSVPADQMTWQYTKVPVDYEFPDVQYEILEECYIPEDLDEEEDDYGLRSGRGFNSEELEEIAYKITGNAELLKGDTTGLRSKAYPSGRIMVYDDSTKTTEGVAGVKIRTTNVLRWRTTYTDANGNYNIPTHYRTKVHYAMIFENVKDFKIGAWHVIAKASVHEMGWHSNKGYDKTIKNGDKWWSHCIVNNAAYYMQQKYGNYLPKDLTYWVIDDSTGSAPMLGHGTARNVKSLSILAGAISVPPDLSPVASTVASIFSFISPDFFIGVKGKNTAYRIYLHTIHETTHSMHFKKVGKEYWNPYIRGIIQCRKRYKGKYTYGKCEESTDYSGYMGVGENWAYAASYYITNNKFSQLERKRPSSEYWFNPYSTYQLFNNKDIDILDFLSCMNSSTTTMSALGEKLHNLKSNISVTWYKDK